MLLSIVIVTKNRAEDLEQTLTALRRAEIPATLRGEVEVVVADNGSTDRTPQVVAAANVPGIRVRHESVPGIGKAHALNGGVRAARGEIILFTDDDVVPSPTWLAAMTEPILSGRADSVAGGVRLADHLDRRWMEPMHRGMLASTEGYDPQDPPSCIGANWALSRKVFKTIPAFDEELGPGALGFCEDLLFTMQMKQAGIRIVSAYGKDATVEHHFQASRLAVESFEKRAATEGRSLAYIAYHWQHAPVPNAAIFWMKRRLRLQLIAGERRRLEGFPTTAYMSVLQDSEFFRQTTRYQGKPRHYDQYGLVKQSGLLPVAPLTVG